MMRPAFLAFVAVTLACAKEPRSSPPDELPVLTTSPLPFHYPPALAARKVQGDVMLKLYIDRDGRVVPESIAIHQRSSSPVLDSAALVGARDLHFMPAKLHGQPVGTSVIFPVYYRLPESNQSKP